MPGATVLLEPSKIILDLYTTHRAEGPAFGGGPERREGHVTVLELEGYELIGGREPTGARYHYLRGDEETWTRGVPAYSAVAYRNATGAELVLRAGEQGLSFVSTDAVRFRVHGALALEGGYATSQGHVRVRRWPGGGAVEWGARRGCPGGCCDENDEPANPQALLWSTLLGGIDADEAYTVTRDAVGDVLVSGYTNGADFPTTPGAYDSTYGGHVRDAFVAKLRATGGATSLVWATFLGGGDADHGACVLTDSNNHPLLMGFSSSKNFPATTGAFDESLNGDELNVFVTKLAQDGSGLVWSTFVGPCGSDGAERFSLGGGMALDPLDAVVLVTGTKFSSFPATAGAYDLSLDGQWDAVAAKLDESGSSLMWSTFLGSAGKEMGYGVEVVADGVVVVGATDSSGFPTTPGVVGEVFSGDADAFVTRLSGDGAVLAWSTLLGGKGDDRAYSVALDGGGQPIVFGSSTSKAFPTTPGAFQGVNAGGVDGFVSKMRADGQGFVFSTLIGGSLDDVAAAGGIDGEDRPVLMMQTLSPDYPTTFAALDPTFNGHEGSTSCQDIAVTKFHAGGEALSWSTFVGGHQPDYRTGLHVDWNGNVVLAGTTGSPDFPLTTGAFDDTLTSSFADGFVLELSHLAKVAVPHASDAQRSRAFPNPARLAATISRASTGPVTCTIYDASGRHIRTIWTTQARIVWDGRDSARRAAPPGVYPYQLNGHYAGKITLTR